MSRPSEAVPADCPVKAVWAVSDESRKNCAQRSCSAVSPIRSEAAASACSARRNPCWVRVPRGSDQTLSSLLGGAHRVRGDSPSGHTRTPRRRLRGCAARAPPRPAAPNQAGRRILADSLDQRCCRPPLEVRQPVRRQRVIQAQCLQRTSPMRRRGHRANVVRLATRPPTSSCQTQSLARKRK